MTNLFVQFKSDEACPSSPTKLTPTSKIPIRTANAAKRAKQLNNENYDDSGLTPEEIERIK